MRSWACSRSSVAEHAPGRGTAERPLPPIWRSNAQSPRRSAPLPVVTGEARATTPFLMFARSPRRWLPARRAAGARVS